MASFSLLYIARQFFLAPAEFAQAHPHPWLVWTPPNGARPIVGTDIAEPGGQASDPTKPVALELVKGAGSGAFQFGITLGHADHNDLVLRDPTVSRFHAYFRVASGRVTLVDADSKNGTFVDDARLAVSAAVQLPDEALLRFGNVVVRYFSPQRFTEYLEREAGGG